MKLKVGEIKRELKRQKMSVRDLANKMQVKRQMVYYWLKHPDCMTLKTVTRLAKALKVNPLNLLTQR